MMGDRGDLWVILLAAGNGTRVHGQTRDTFGEAIPKQYYQVDGESSMLDWARARARRLVPADHVMAVVAAEHRRWWEVELADMSHDNLIVQPMNRGTAAGILLPLFAVLERSPTATVVILPTDHFVAEENRLHDAMLGAVDSVKRRDAELLLLGVAPSRPENQYGWIVPTPPRHGSLQRIERFVEKPERAVAEELMQRGGLLNTLMIVANAGALLHLYELALPRLTGGFLGLESAERGGRSALANLYLRLSSHDFSREVLECFACHFAVASVPDCGWSDLGTPERLHDFTRHLRVTGRGSRGARALAVRSRTMIDRDRSRHVKRCGDDFVVPWQL
jgi:mannose-1-phosphate guanylyltransferase